MMNVRPAGNRVLLKLLKAPEKVGGLIMPDEAKPKRNEALVMAVGPQVEEFLQGDKVLFNHYCAIKIKEDDNDHFLIDAKEIYCVLE